MKGIKAVFLENKITQKHMVTPSYYISDAFSNMIFVMLSW